MESKFFSLEEIAQEMNVSLEYVKKCFPRQEKVLKSLVLKVKKEHRKNQKQAIMELMKLSEELEG